MITYYWVCKDCHDEGEYPCHLQTDFDRASDDVDTPTQCQWRSSGGKANWILESKVEENEDV